MAALRSVALQEQISIIMGALTSAAVQEICELVAEGYQVLQAEIQRRHKENQDLRKKLHLIESIVVRGGREGIEPAAEGKVTIEPAAEGEQQPESDRGDAVAAAGGGGVVVMREELPDVVLIKDEDSDSNHSLEEDEKTSASRELVQSPPVSRNVKRVWPGGEDADRKSSSELPKPAKKNFPVYLVDSPPRSEPGCSSSLETGESLGSFSSQMDLNRPGFFSLTESPTSSPRATLQTTESPTSSPRTRPSFPRFHQNGNLDDDGGAFGLKMVSVSGSFQADSQPTESSDSSFQYEMNLASFGDLMPGQDQQFGDGSKRLVCPVCSKTYATSQNLEVHLRIHTGERPFRCGQCGKKFTQSAHLKAHISVHSGERPYLCTLCPRSFIVKYSLKLHMDRCHAPGGQQNIL